jgi:hypothetical protein
MIITLRDPYNGAEKLFNLDKFIHSYPAIDGGYELVFDDERIHMDYKEYERFKAAIVKAQEQK